MGRVFTNGSGDRCSIPGRVIPKTKKKKKCYLIPPCLTLSTIRHISRVKWSNLGKEVPSATPRCCSNWKGAFGSPSTTFANFTFIMLLVFHSISNLCKLSNAKCCLQIIFNMNLYKRITIFKRVRAQLFAGS